jgi:hypothetical protein
MIVSGKKTLDQTLSSQHVQAYGDYPTGLEGLILRGARPWARLMGAVTRRVAGLQRS